MVIGQGEAVSKRYDAVRVKGLTDFSLRRFEARYSTVYEFLSVCFHMLCNLSHASTDLNN